MKYQVLGPILVVSGNAVTPVSAPKMGCVLMTLLIRANQIVSKDALIAEIWKEDPPRRAVPALHVYISQLRKLLGWDPAESPIVTRPPGYLLKTEPGQLDCEVFQSLAERGRELGERGELEESARCLEQALALWRGPGSSDLGGDGPIVTGFLTWLEELRLECLEDLIEVSLALGRHRAMVRLLLNLVAEHPLHERFYGQLMRALHASERRADALRVYSQARAVLSSELGLEPGRALQELHATVLTSDSLHSVGVAV